MSGRRRFGLVRYPLTQPTPGIESPLYLPLHRQPPGIFSGYFDNDYEDRKEADTVVLVFWKDPNKFVIVFWH
jgi:hypothetical protein